MGRTVEFRFREYIPRDYEKGVVFIGKRGSVWIVYGFGCYLPDKHIHYISTRTDISVSDTVSFSGFNGVIAFHHDTFANGGDPYGDGSVTVLQQRVTFILIPRHLQHTGGEH